MNAIRSLLAAGAFLAGAVLHAGTITYSAAVNGLTAPAGVTFTAVNPADLMVVTNNDLGVVYLGVKAEISLEESLTLTFATPQIFEYLTLGLLFDGPEYDDFNEKAGAFPNGAVTPFVLTATGLTAADWTLASSTVINLSQADTSGAGVWKIMNPFGTMPISSLLLTPIANNPSPQLNESDFGLVAFQTRNVPDSASTAVLFALALVGLLGVSRRRR